MHQQVFRLHWDHFKTNQDNKYIQRYSLMRLSFNQFVLLIVLLLCISCNYDEKEETPIIISSGDLKAAFIDNDAYGDQHKKGYNGISELSHSAQDSSIFVPFYAGFNLEHIFGGDSLTNLFEPRKSPMHMMRISDTEVELYQPETPLSHVESWTTFKLMPPHYVDVHFRCVMKSAEFFKHGYAGMFWASYIHAPQDLKIYFRGKEQHEEEMKWIGAYSTSHGNASTHIWARDTFDLFAVPGFNITLANHYSDYLFNEPFYYGRFHNMIFAYLFEKPSEGIIRFSQSPTGGGQGNPAWDFQFIIPDFIVDKEYEFSTRLVYKEWKGAEDIVKEYKLWKDKLMAD